jgi:DinB family protein
VSDILGPSRRVLATTVGRWQSLVDAGPEELLLRAPAPGEWSAAECLAHLLQAERLAFGQRLRAILEGRELTVFNPGQAREPEPERTPAEAVAALAAERSDNLAILSGLTEADLDRSGHHAEYGAVTLGTVLAAWAAHDLNHTVQAEEALMQAFLPHTGPFRSRFEAHDLRS